MKVFVSCVCIWHSGGMFGIFPHNLTANPSCQNSQIIDAFPKKIYNLVIDATRWRPFEIESQSTTQHYASSMHTIISALKLRGQMQISYWTIIVQSNLGLRP